MRSFGDGLVIGVRDFAFKTGLCVGLDLSGYRRRYCYARRKDAEAALADWDGRGDPPGPWIKVKPTDRLGPGSKCGCDHPPPTPDAEGVFRVSNDCPTHGDKRSGFVLKRWAGLTHLMTSGDERE